ncbi:MAG: MarR family transcriptional regulator [Alphaproteobacteria bacterium]|nr:MarR family transcriptional regulator [Alphaproteobacteria bacterium]
MALSAPQALNLWRGALVESLRRGGPDLTARQVAVLLTVYLTAPPHTVRGLASGLKVSKAAISRSLDRLSQLELVRRRVDEADRRSVLVQKTVRGSDFLAEFADLVIAAERDVSAAPAPTA